MTKYDFLIIDYLELFFCKHNEPDFIKIEKLNIIDSLIREQNAVKVLKELKNYIDFKCTNLTQRCIKCIGKIGLLYQNITKECIELFISLIQTKNKFIIQECVINIVNIFRKYPKQYEYVIPIICQYINDISDYKAKSSLVWIIGEYSAVIQNVSELINNFLLNNFVNEQIDVQLAILTAIVKLYLVNNEEKEMLKQVLYLSIHEVGIKDLKDRAYLYLCLLTESPSKLKEVVTSDLPCYTPELSNNDIDNDLIYSIGSICSMCEFSHKQKLIPNLIKQNENESNVFALKYCKNDSKDQYEDVKNFEKKR